MVSCRSFLTRKFVCRGEIGKLCWFFHTFRFNNLVFVGGGFGYADVPYVCRCGSISVAFVSSVLEFPKCIFFHLSQSQARAGGVRSVSGSVALQEFVRRLLPLLSKCKGCFSALLHFNYRPVCSAAQAYFWRFLQNAGARLYVLLRLQSAKT